MDRLCRELCVEAADPKGFSELSELRFSYLVHSMFLIFPLQNVARPLGSVRLLWTDSDSGLEHASIHSVSQSVRPIAIIPK